MKKWNTKKIKAEVDNALPAIYRDGSKGQIAKFDSMYDALLQQFIAIVDVVEKRNLKNQVDIKKLIETVCIDFNPDDYFWGHRSGKCLLTELAEKLDDKIIPPDFLFPQMPPKKKEFTVKMAAKATRQTERTIRDNIDAGKLIAEYRGRSWIILRKNLLSYKKKLKLK